MNPDDALQTWAKLSSQTTFAWQRWIALSEAQQELKRKARQEYEKALAQAQELINLYTSSWS